MFANTLSLLFTVLPLAGSDPCPWGDSPGSSVESDRSEPVALAEGKAQAEQEAELGETLVTAGRLEAELSSTPFAVDLIDEQQLRERSYRTLPQALRDTPGVFVQETSYGQGSPYIRGWTGFRNLLLIDGIRLNNSVFRDGPNQYWNTVDVYSIEDLEVVKGPGAVIWGSDAIGGTVNALTNNAWKHLADGKRAGGLFYYRQSSAENSNIARVESGLGIDADSALALGFTGKHFGDFEAGRDLGLQPYTGYDEWNLDIKYERFLAPDTRLVVAHNRTQQRNVPRTHKTIFGQSFEGTTIGSDLRRDLDQDRDLTYVQILGQGLARGRRVAGVIDDYALSLSWQNQSENRDRTRSSGSQEQQGFDADTLGLFAWGSAPSDLGRWTFGADWYRDFVDSFSSRNPIQGPVADDATYDLFGVFVQDQIPVGDSTDLIVGLRGQRAVADANNVSDPVTGERISLREDWSQLVGSVRAIRSLSEDVEVFAGVSQAFRAPNLSDLTRFDTARSNEFEIPSPDLDPETFLSYELGLRAANETHSGELSLYYTDVQDLIIRRPTGNTNSDGEAEITKENAGDGYVLGVEARASWKPRPDWTVFGQLAWMDGKVETFPPSAPDLVEEPIDRLLPFQGQAGLRYDDFAAKGWAELQVTFAGKADKLSTRDEADTQRIPPGGTPGYVVLDLRAGKQLSEHVRVEGGLTNLLDEDYRVHGSGSNRPGRSVVVGLTLTR